MGDKTAIGWTDATWNPVTGCSKVSPGCAHCYAESLTRRFAKAWGVPDLPWTPENAEENVILHPERLDQPLRWKRPRMVFVNSMSDLFHEEVPDSFIGLIFQTMAMATQHTFQVLTKRPERMRDYLLRSGTGEPGVPLSNVWLGTSIENRRYVYRADLLRETPAAVRFISAEPLLGPLVYDEGSHVGGYEDANPIFSPAGWSDRERFDGAPLDLTDIDWLIVGGESGPGHRPMRVEWVRDLRDACLALQDRHERCSAAACDYDETEWPHHPGGRPLLCPRCAEGELLSERIDGPAFFFKQWGGATPKAGGRVLDGRIWDEMPVSREAVAA
jgi:protein gp37